MNQFRLQAVEALMIAELRQRAADTAQRTADAAYCPAFRSVDRFRQWQELEAQAKVLRRKAQADAWKAGHLYLEFHKP
jgi:hypothetical protein